MKRAAFILLLLTASVLSVSARGSRQDSTALTTKRATDSVEIFHPDSTLVAQIDSVYTAYIDSLSQYFPDSTDIRKAIRKIKKEERDSIRINKPRILETFVVPDTMWFRRILIWNSDSKFNEAHMVDLDTTFNYHYNDYPMMKKDVNATYLGTVGSATLYHNYFRRESVDQAPMFTPYIGDSHTSETVRQFNVKTPYTELAYWGTLLAKKEMEEADLNLLTTQNITPGLNITLSYQRYGSKGMLKNENTSNQNTYIYANYMGKKYFVNAGHLRQTVTREENGGIVDSQWIRDTTIDTKAIEVTLDDADNKLKRRSYFIHQTYAIPMNFFRKNRDSLAVGEGTTAYIGHSLVYNTYSKEYTDKISLIDRNARDFYFNQFNFNQTASHEKLYAGSLDNKIFIKLQPFAPDAIVSKINGGIGYQMLKTKNTVFLNDSSSIYGRNVQNNFYVYAGVNGQFRKYLHWEADADYYLAGYKMMDFDINGKITFSAYPLEQGIHLTGKFSTSLKEPHPFEQTLLTNHHHWENNNFKKVSETRIEGNFTIPKWKLEAFFGYALTGNMIYYDTLSVVRQHSEKPVNVISAYLRKDFKIWWFHLDNKILFQKSSNEEVLPLPMLSLNLRYYLQFPVVKDVMEMQIGLNGLMHTAYYAPAYSPDLGQFYNQTREKIGGVPYFDAFVNVQWKRACVFIKVTNVFKGWPASDYFSAYHYIRPGREFKLGIFWPFY